MDYMGWILSIYDECERRYKKVYKKKQVKNEINGPKDFLKRCLRKENVYEFLLIATLIVGMILIVFLYLIGMLKDIMYPIFFLIIGFEMGLIPILYRYEPSIEDYERKLTILVEILEERNLNTKEIKKLLLRKTRSILYRIMPIIFSLIGALLPSGLAKYIIEVLKEKMQTLIPILIVVIILLGIVLIGVYAMATTIPNNRIKRKQKFHQLLKILYVYELKEDSGDDEENILGNINIKELAGKIKEHL